MSRILYLSLESPREGQASYAHVFEIINGLRQEGWEVELFCPSYSKGWERPGLIGRLTEYARVQWRLWQSVTEDDVIYVRSHFLAWPIARLAARKGLTVIQEINGPYEDLFISYPWTQPFSAQLSWLQRSQFQMASALIVVTEQLKHWVEAQLDGMDVEVVPNGANTDLFRPGAPCALDLPERFAVFFGGFARWQGLTTMLDAVAAPEWPEGVSLVIVGDGQERELVRQAAARNPRVLWLGRQPYDVVPGVVSRSLCGLVPKNNQGDREKTGLFPLKVFETLACGVPAVVTDFPGQADLVRDNQVGLVVPPENPRALAAAVAALAADPDAVAGMGRRGVEVIQANHSWLSRARQTARVIARARARVRSGL